MNNEHHIYRIFIFFFRRGYCGAWSYDFLNAICYLHNVDACCGQFNKREENYDFVSGYTCTSCWTTKSDCTDDFCTLIERQYCKENPCRITKNMGFHHKFSKI